MTRPLHAWTSHHYALPLPDAHRLPIAKNARLLERLLAEQVLEAAHVHASELAPREWLMAAHDEDYVARVFEGRLDAAEIRALGLSWSEALVARARAAVFGTVMAARAALVHGVAGNLAGGSHHAFRDRAEAYCLWNDLAIAIQVLRAQGRARRPFVLDLDVHQGNGTAAIFAGDDSVFTLSIHQENNYPVPKQQSDLDLGLADRAGDHEYLAALAAALETVWRFAPDLVLYQAGADPYGEDQLGGLGLTRDGLERRDRELLGGCGTRGIPVVVTLGGGYARRLEDTIAIHTTTCRIALASAR